MREWFLGKFFTIDEMMVRYKGSYCPIRQYMPKKMEKWDIKFWVLADSASKFIYCFEVYCGKNVEADIKVQIPQSEAGAAYGVVMKLLEGQRKRGIVWSWIIISIPFHLFRDLLAKGIYTTNTVRYNYVGLPSHLKKYKVLEEM